MKRGIVVVSIVISILAVVSLAETPSQMPQPGPEQKRLQYYAGTWTSEYEMKPGAMGPGGKMTATDVSHMQPGGFFLITHTEGKGFMGELNEMAVMGYDAEAKIYTYDSYNNFGEADHFKGTVQGDTWTWNGETRSGGNPIKLRFTAKEVSPKMYTMKLEMLKGADWVMVMEGKSTKTK